MLCIELLLKTAYQSHLNVSSGRANFTRISGTGEEYCVKTKAETTPRNTLVFQSAGEFSLLGIAWSICNLKLGVY